MTYKVMAKIDFNDKDNGDIKREANKSTWEIKDKKRVDFLLGKGAIEILPETEIRKERNSKLKDRDKNFMI